MQVRKLASLSQALSLEKQGHLSVRENQTQSFLDLHCFFSVSYPVIQPPASTSFKCYSRKKSKTSVKDDEDEDLLVVGETNSVEFTSNEDECRKVANAGCRCVSSPLFRRMSCNIPYVRYLFAVRNTRTGTISILPSPKTPHIFSHTVKALKSLPSLDVPSKLQYLEAKTALGESFGTKKQKANIRAQERNKIDVKAMEGVMKYVMDSIDKGAEGLMTAGSLFIIYWLCRD
jgi:DNA-directed RNA polymerase I subunit RPA49